MRSYRIHKPTHKIFDAKGTPAIGLVQIRGNRSACINRLHNGGFVESALVQSLGLESLMRGVAGDIGELQFIWRFCFGATAQFPVSIEKHDPHGVTARLAEIRAVIKSESISYDDIVELQGIAEANPAALADDVLLQDWAGLPE